MSLNSDHDKYACVPESWLRWYAKQSSEAIVVYPEGNLAITNGLVRKNQSDVKSWKTYMVFVEYSSRKWFMEIFTPNPTVSPFSK